MAIDHLLSLSRRYSFSSEQMQRVEAAALSLPAPQRDTFRQRVAQVVRRSPMSRGVATDPLVGVAIGVALRELTAKAAS
jgi:hypothetical protein